jgi:hypothetical protein
MNMSSNNGTALATVDRAGAIEAALVEGDLSKLSTEDRITYFNRMCESIGLNPTTKPFEYLTLNGKLVLYARKDCTDQLRSLRKVSISIASRDTVGGVYVVTARATLPDGRADESTGAVACEGLRGDAMANALMKAETKAKRRVTLSICGLGILDESELDTIKGAVVAEAPKETDPTVVAEWVKEFDTAEDEPTFRARQALCKKQVTDLAALNEIGVSAVRNAKRLGITLKVKA